MFAFEKCAKKFNYIKRSLSGLLVTNANIIRFYFLMLDVALLQTLENAILEQNRLDL
jgi:hypothetical protein